MNDHAHSYGEPELRSLLSDEVLGDSEKRFAAMDRGRSLSLESAAQPPVFQNPPKKVVRRLRQIGVSKSEARRAVDLMIAKGGAAAAAESYAVPTEALPPELSEDAVVGLERILGRNELMNVRFLAVGAHRAGTVARVVVRGDGGSVRGYGTGFMVSPRLFLTNNHVLRDRDAAATSAIQFNYEVGYDGRLFEPEEFRLVPDDFFVTDRRLDFTLVAVKPAASNGKAVSDFGFIPMEAEEDNILVNETVNIVQHPNGERKQVALRENEVVGVAEDTFLLYKTDTAPGSSGSCVLNDQWELVALHHAGKPKRDAQGRVLTRDGRVWDRHTMSDREIDWIANEGIRIPAILRHLRGLDGLTKKQKKLLEAILSGSGDSDSHVLRPPNTEPPSERDPKDKPIEKWLPVVNPDGGKRCDRSATVRVSTGESTVIVPLEITVRALPAQLPGSPLSGVSDAGRMAAFNADVSEQEAISIDPDYGGRPGYDADFLGDDEHHVRLPWLSVANYAKVAFNREAADWRQRHVLPYHHYSVVMNAERRLAFFTAVNIDGSRRRDITRGTDKWFFDPRIGRDEQVGNELYYDNPLDRGHLVRRLDPAWGSSLEVATVANDDTFHYTNCAPQHKGFNRNKKTWQGIENYILDNAETHGLKVSVFTGPVFRNSDRVHRGIRIPRDFWKVVAMRRTNGRLSATAYLLSQRDLIEDLPMELAGGEFAEDFQFGDYKLRQVPIWRVEELTGLSFRRLKAFDPKGEEALFEAESLAGVQQLTDLSQIVL